MVAGSGSELRTGTFNSFNGNRSVSVEVAGDKKAFLVLEPRNGPNCVFQNTIGPLSLDFSRTEPVEGKGVGKDSVNECDTAFSILFPVRKIQRYQIK